MGMVYWFPFNPKVYYIVDGKSKELGEVNSSGTVYPIT